MEWSVFAQRKADAVTATVDAAIASLGPIDPWAKVVLDNTLK